MFAYPEPSSWLKNDLRRFSDCGLWSADCGVPIADYRLFGKNAGFGGGLCGCLVCGRGFATAKQCVKPSKTRLQPRRAVFSLRLVSMVVSPKNQASNRLKMRFHPNQSQIHIPQSTFPNPNPFPCPQQKSFCVLWKSLYILWFCCIFTVSWKLTTIQLCAKYIQTIPKI